MPTSTPSKVPVVLITILSLAMKPKLETLGLLNVALLVPSYVFPMVVIPEIVIGFAVIFTVGDDDWLVIV